MPHRSRSSGARRPLDRPTSRVSIAGVYESLRRYSTKADDEFIYFNQVVHLQLPLEALQSAEAAIFMEFKHYKVKQNKQSVT